MSYFRPATALAAIVLPLLLLLAVAVAHSAQDSVYQRPTVAELSRGERMFVLLFDGAELQEARDIAAELGFSWKESDVDIVLTDNNRRGWGEYRFSRTVANKIAIQAPHRYHDRQTGTLTMRLFRRGAAASIALNSVSRRTPLLNQPSAQADMARMQDSFHAVYARAFARRFPRGQLLQLHGFDARKRSSNAARKAEIILSSGSPWASPYLVRVQDCFTRQGWHALRYPDQVRELGATRNSIGSLLRNIGHRGFTHIELNQDMRQRLVADAALLASFATCLVEGEQ